MDSGFKLLHAHVNVVCIFLEISLINETLSMALTLTCIVLCHINWDFHIKMFSPPRKFTTCCIASVSVTQASGSLSSGNANAMHHN